MAANENRGFVGVGNIIAELYLPNGALSGVREDMGDGNKFELKTNVDILDLPSHRFETPGQIEDTVYFPKPAELSITLVKATKTNLALQFQATQSDVEVGAATITARPLVAKLDKWIDIGNQNLNDATMTVTNADASTTFVRGVDYRVNPRLGLFMALSTGDIEADEALKFTGASLAFTGSRLLGGTKTSVRARLFFDGKNYAGGRRITCTIHDAELSPTGAFDFLKQGWNEIPLSGRMKTPEGLPSPFEVFYFD